MPKQELVDKLSKLGLTHKQAKIYTVIITCKSCTVKEISEQSGVYPQDIYQVLPTLEKHGLVTRTINRPIKVEAVSIETALNKWFEIQEQKLESQKQQVQEIIKEIKTAKSSIRSKPKKKLFILYEGTKSMENTVVDALKNAKNNYETVIPEEIFRKSLPCSQTGPMNFLAEHGVKAKILVRTDKHTNEDLIKMITLAGLNTDIFKVKATRKNEDLYYTIIDENEIWVALEYNKTKTAVFSVLVTDNEAIVKPYVDHFQTLWMDPETKTLLK